MDEHRLCMTVGGGGGGGWETEVQVSVMAGSPRALAPHGPSRRPLRQHDRDAGLRRIGIRWQRRRGSRGFLRSTASVNSLLVGRQRHPDSFHHDRAGLAGDSLLPPAETHHPESALSPIGFHCQKSEMGSHVLSHFHWGHRNNRTRIHDPAGAAAGNER